MDNISRRRANWPKLASQALSGGLFVYLIAATTLPLRSVVPPDLFLRADPLAAVAASLASRAVASNALTALVLIALTLLFGRFFCGLVCPVGACLDAADALGLRRLRRRLGVRVPDLSRAKFALLLIILLAAALGSVSLLWLDPISLATRTAALVAWPLASHGAHWAAGGNGFGPSLAIDVASALVVAALVASVVLQPRFWCRNLCPLGAGLGLVGRLGLRRAVPEACPQCGKCREACHTGAIRADARETLQAECTLCLACQSACPADAVRFRWGAARPRSEPAGGGRVPRREVLRLGGATVGGIVLGSWLRPAEASSEGLRPPGAQPEPLFRALCIRCGQCIKACASDALQPATLAGGLDGCWTPEFRPRSSPCDRDCNVCGQVCPTGAIAPLPVPAKNRCRIGVARIRRTACLPWAREELCQVCRDACIDAGHDAIEFRFEGGFLRVYVREDRCTGCGYCEFRCPVGIDPRTGRRAAAAIVVEPLPPGEPRRLAERDH